LANQPASTGPGDGLILTDAYVGAVNRCAPPANKPTPDERDNCLPYLVAEIGALERLRVVVALGAFAWDGVLRALAVRGHVGRPKPAFAHAAEAVIGPFAVVGCFHPSQQNTFTGRLTPAMLDAVLERARQLAGG
jgi:uracil-DNA glycosylase family 4